VVVLAAGQGKRMKSELPKVLHPVCGRPMLLHVLEAAAAVSARRTIVVLGHEHQLVLPYLPRGCEVALQERQLGTGHALKAAAAAILPGEVLVLSGDTPLITGDLVCELVEAHASSGAVATVATMELADPTGYGRVVRASDGSVLRIVEHRDAGVDELDIAEVNAGLYVLPWPLSLEILGRVGAENDQGEIYLTDVIAALDGRGERVGAWKVADPASVLGVNTKEELAEAEALMKVRVRHEKPTSETQTDSGQR
jgi:bifunctional UDP-N-acetylglucosamine pyrophosphorylase / glucosamine-1-phosphate N-acetyltransferase